MMSLLAKVPRSREEFSSTVQSLMSSKAVQSAFWVLLGSGGYQIIRLLSNLLLTRLLFPELFGMMAIVTAVMVGLGQISDVGLREGVVNSNRINDPTFMRTAWTLQIVRSAVICLLGIIIAFPLAEGYGEPLLAPVLSMIALCTFMTGFKSVAPLAYDKRLDLKTQMLVDLAIQVASVLLVIVWAWISPTIWAMVAGQFFASVLDVAFSYLLFKGHHSKLAWDKEVVRKLIAFGKWILISSVISYVTVQGDRLILGIFLTMGELGIYSNAATWAAIVSLLSVNISTRVLHPYFRQAIDNHSDYKRIALVRGAINVGYMGVCVVLAVIGDWLIKFAYDDRYIEGGWMLQILALGQVGRALTGTLMPFMMASGDSFSQMKFSACSAVILVISIVLGGWLGGSPGVIFSLAFASVASHPVMVLYATRHGYRCFLSDMGIILAAIVLCGVAWWITDAPILDVMSQFVSNVSDKLGIH